ATKGLVQTSLNNGIMRLDEKSFTLEASVRSSIASQKYALSERLKYLTETIGGQYSVWGDYPGWEFSEDSRITKIVGEKYEELFGKKPLIAGIHAGLECGFISSKMPGIDIVSLGPDIIDIHTPGEKISISSVERVWRLLIAVLEELCK
ncbi:MAG: M20/M25/M40 family metallo-hydrolase, partial [Lachnospiraceae bacterium]|nr:M20/M25/M40 family metallo-hydrolase [Lachnospiraceae bacterium]